MGGGGIHALIWRILRWQWHTPSVRCTVVMVKSPFSSRSCDTPFKDGPADIAWQSRRYTRFHTAEMSSVQRGLQRRSVTIERVRIVSALQRALEAGRSAVCAASIHTCACENIDNQSRSPSGVWRETPQQEPHPQCYENQPRERQRERVLLGARALKATATAKLNPAHVPILLR